MAEGNRLENGHPSDGIVGSNPTLSDFRFEVPDGAPFTLRFSRSSDGEYLRLWLQQPGVLRWFPMASLAEIEDSVNFWSRSLPNGFGITAEIDGQAVGIANINPQPFVKLSHQATISIIITEQCRGQGIGTVLLHNLIKLAKCCHKLKMLHLEVYEGHPAQRLYARVGFVKYGEHPFFMKEDDGSYRAKILMELPFEENHGRS